MVAGARYHQLDRVRHSVRRRWGPAQPRPHAKISVDLVDSMFYHRTDIASMAATWVQLAGYGSLAGMLELPVALGEAALDFLDIASELWTAQT